MNRSILKSLAVASFLGIQSFAVAQLPSQQWVGIVPASEKTAINVFVEVDNERPVVLRLSDSLDTEVWSRSYNKNTVAKSILLDALPQGEYYLTAANADEVLKYKITVDGENVIIDYASAEHIVKPAVSVNGSQVTVDYSTARGAAEVYTRISDDDGRLLFERVVAGAGKRKVTYDLSTVRGGNYTFDFRISDEWFEEGVKISHQSTVAMK